VHCESEGGVHLLIAMRWKPASFEYLSSKHGIWHWSMSDTEFHVTGDITQPLHSRCTYGWHFKLPVHSLQNHCKNTTKAWIAKTTCHKKLILTFFDYNVCKCEPIFVKFPPHLKHYLTKLQNCGQIVSLMCRSWLTFPPKILINFNCRLPFGLCCSKYLPFTQT